MHKIAITGKANTGKNTLANLIVESFPGKDNYLFYKCKLIAFADPLKKIAKIMFPFLKKSDLYGSSKNRSKTIEGAKNSEGNPLTIRQCLIDVGSKLGRGYNDSIWLNVFNDRFKKEVKKNIQLVIVTDVRFRNEFDHLKNQGFFMVKLIRHYLEQSSDASETNQDGIDNAEYDFIVYNNSDLQSLENNAKLISTMVSLK